MTNAQKKIFLLMLLIVACALSGIISESMGRAEENTSRSILQGEEDSEKNFIRIYVSGAVLRPGLYDLDTDARADDAIKAAGGLTELADLERTNLARKLKDGMQVNVPAQKIRSNSQSADYKKLVTKSSVPTKNSAAKTKATSSVPKASASKSSEKNFTVINLNTASAEELEQVPGIGPVMAERIIEFREKQKFTVAEDLLKVKGIGKAKLSRMKEYVKAE